MLEKYWEENPLKIKNFRLFIIAHFISFTGTWLRNIAQIWLVYELTSSSFYLGLFGFLSSLPTSFLTFLAGILIDIFDKRKLLIGIYFLAIFPPLILGILTQFKIITFWYITSLAFLSACLSALDTPLRQVFISEIVPLRLLTKAISFQSLSFNLARFLGPFLAVFIISYGNLYECFYLSALSFIPFLIFLIFFIKPRKTKEKELKKTNNYLQIKNAFEEIYLFLKKERKILFINLSVCTFTLFGASITILFPLIVHKFYNKGGEEFAFLSSVLGIGAIFGAIFVILKKSIENKTKHLFKATFLLSIGLLGLGLVYSWYFTLICCFLIGFAFTNFFPVANSYLQEITPYKLRGRVISFFTFSFLGVYPIGTFLAGFLAEKINLHLLFIFYSLILFLLNAYFLNSKIKN